MSPHRTPLILADDDLLRERVHRGLAIMIGASLLFTLADLKLQPDPLAPLFVIQAIELLGLLSAVALLYRTWTREGTIWIAVAAVSFICATTSLSGMLNGDISTTLLMLSIITLCTATLLPWGIRPQIVVQSVAAVAVACNVYVVDGSAYALRHFLLGVVVGFGAALYAAYTLEQHRLERERAEAVLEETRSRQHQAELAHAARLSTLGEMAAGLAHELNQPLTAIVGYATGCLVRVDAGTADLDMLARVVGEISDEAQRAGDVLQRMREFARSGAIRRERIDPNTLVRGAARLAGGDARKLDVEVALELAADLPAIDVDRVQIEQVIVNLLLNAFEAMTQTRRGDRRAVVQTRRSDAGAIEVTIGDSGEGLAPATANRIFDPFFSTKADGLGLGLAISRRIVEAHGGSLWATPNTTRGMTFHFTLPAAAREASDAA